MIRHAGRAAGMMMAVPFVAFAMFMAAVLGWNVTVAVPEPVTAAAPGLACGVGANPAVLADIWAVYAGGVNPDQTTWKVADADVQARMQVAIAAAVKAGFAGDNLVVISSLAGRESNYHPTAFNGNSKTGDLSYGLWQINMIGDLGPANRERFGITSNDQLYDPETAAHAAMVLYQASAAVPFFAWGPYRGDPPLHGGAELWVPEVIRVATAMGYLDTDGNPTVPAAAGTPTAPPVGGTTPAGGAAPSPCGGVPLEGPDCDGITGTGATFNGVAFQDITPADMLTWSPNSGYMQPAASAAWDQLVAAAVEAGFAAEDLHGTGWGPRPNTPSSNHPGGMAIDVDSLTWDSMGPAVNEPGEPLPVYPTFDSPLYKWLRANAHLYGYCNPRALRPLRLNGTATGGHAADGTGNYLEAWHWEYVGGSTNYNGARSGDLNGPLGVPD